MRAYCKMERTHTSIDDQHHLAVASTGDRRTELSAYNCDRFFPFYDFYSTARNRYTVGSRAVLMENIPTTATPKKSFFCLSMQNGMEKNWNHFEKIESGQPKYSGSSSILAQLFGRMHIENAQQMCATMSLVSFLFLFFSVIRNEPLTLRATPLRIHYQQITCTLNISYGCSARPYIYRCHCSPIYTQFIRRRLKEPHTCHSKQLLAPITRHTFKFRHIFFFFFHYLLYISSIVQWPHGRSFGVCVRKS